MNKGKIYRELKKKIKGLDIKKDFDLYPFNTYKVHAIAPIFIRLKNLGETLKLMDYIRENKLDFVFLGNGSNVLILNPKNKIFVKFDKNYNKIVINQNIVRASASCLLGEVTGKAIANNLKGMEESIGIPGTIGGAVYMNASAGNFEISKFVDSVIVLEDGKVKLYKNNECEFGYRESIFQKNKAVILEVFFRLEKVENFDFNLVIKEMLLKRKNSQPLSENSAGSVFKNFGEIKAAKLIDESGLKGYQIGGAKISEKHANFIVTNNASSEDIFALISYVQKVIFERYKIMLETEIKVI